MLLSLDNACKIFADRIIFMGVSVKIEPGDRIGLVGANGVGKTTVLRVLNGEFLLDEGTRSLQNNTTIGFLRQNNSVNSRCTIKEEMKSVFAYLLDVRYRMNHTEALLAKQTDPESSAYQKLSAEYNELASYFETNDGYLIDVNIETVLNGMGFKDKDRNTLCSQLSGGEKTRLGLAKLLLLNPDILILDEPTNHLDFRTLQWLEEYLQSYKGALVVVSHDRYFLDNLCTKIWELSALQMTTYKGNYTAYTKLRIESYNRQLKEYIQQQELISKLNEYIVRNKTRASTATMAKSKEKELERMQLIARPPKQTNPIRLSFLFEEPSAKNVLQIKNLTLTTPKDNVVLCSSINFELMRGEKVALIGSNGVGKTTFLKTLLRKTSSQPGCIRWGKNVKISYFEQEQSELHPHKTVISELWDRYPSTYEQDIRTVLGNLHFSGNDIYKKIESLSGGEKARLKFAIMMYESGNILILDEPSNHLDLETKEVLDEALMRYEGTILMVSHDRYLLNKVPNKIAEMTPTGFIWYQGGYQNYLEQKQSLQIEKNIVKTEPDNEDQPNDYYRSKKERAQQVAKKSRLVIVEKEIMELESKITEIEQQMETPKISRDYQTITRLCEELDDIKNLLNIRMEEWADLSQ